MHRIAMQTTLTAEILHTPQGQLADRILRSCVHCGFCNATCPTYQLLGDELDGPRGRIYQIKQMLEGQKVSANTLTHLDRCLTCRNCETTCPSGVQYGRLLEIGRDMAEHTIHRSISSELQRWILRKIIPYRERFILLLRIGQIFRPLLPAVIQQKIPVVPSAQDWPTNQHARRMLILEGCVQPAVAPTINYKLAHVLDKLGISALRATNEVCCGAASQHTSGHAEALDFARRNIDAWWPHIQQGVEALLSTASGCGVHVKDYATLLADDPTYAAKAKQVSELCKDVSEVVAQENFLSLNAQHNTTQKIVFHPPCTLQHGQKITGLVEKILRELGYELLAFNEPHLCCGSAGTYSILQPVIATQLRDRKLVNLQQPQPYMIATANIGCQLHLQSATTLPVKHWVELLI